MNNDTDLIKLIFDYSILVRPKMLGYNGMGFMKFLQMFNLDYTLSLKLQVTKRNALGTLIKSSNPLRHLQPIISQFKHLL